MRLQVFTSPAWQATVARFALLLLIATGAGLALGEVAWALVAALGGYVAYSLYSLHRLRQWLATRRRLAPPELHGAWGETAEWIAQQRRGGRLRQRRLLGLLRAFRSAAKVIPDAVVVLDDARKVVWLNRAAAQLLRMRLARDRGRLIDDFLPTAQVHGWLSGDPSQAPLIDVPAPDEERKRLSLRMIGYTDGLHLLLIRDISALIRSEQIRRDFVANVSHELRTPLTVLHGYLDLIEPEELPQLAPVLDDLRAQTQRMTRIVEDLLILSRIEAPQAPPDEIVAMDALLAALYREAEGLSRQRHRIALNNTAAVDLRGAQQYLHSAFSNLIANAVRYTPDGGQIEIAWQRHPDGGARLVVSDTGYGIPAEHLPRVTERFYRVSTSRSRGSGGTGLGLSIVKHVLAMHGARLGIDSEVGVGSRFVCIFDRSRLIERGAVIE